MRQSLKIEHHSGLAGLWLSAALLMVSVDVAATGTSALPTPQAVSLKIGKQPGAELQLETRQAPLAAVIAEIAAKTKVAVHYSVLPEEPVTATCVAGKVQQLLECLVGRQIGVVSHKAETGNQEEVWLIGSSVGGCPAVTTALPVPAIAEAKPLTPAEQAEADRLGQEQVQAMLKQTKSKDANERFSALGNLATPAAKGDAEVGKAMQDALQDKDSNVRSQAIASIATLGGDDMAEQLGQALKDKDVNVRMSVVSAVNSDAGLLRQALGDKDAAVRNLAQSKLDQLERLASRQSQ